MINGRYTPWDSLVFGVPTYEIQSIDYSDNNSALKALKENSFCNAKIIYGKFLASDFKAKELLIKSGYLPCEVSFRVTLGKLQDYTLPKLYAKKKTDLYPLDKAHFSKISALAQDMFKYSRFHEDPFIPQEKADKRMEKWVLDLKNQEVNCVVSKTNKEEIISFMIFNVDYNLNVELILGGSKKGFELHSPYFWGTVIDYLKNQGFKKISTTISAANSGVLSLYQNLGFKISETKVDYHKHL